MHASPRAKINLTLAVGPRGDDGYHPIESLIVRVGLADELVVAFADHGADTLTVTGLPGCPVDGNLVLRAFAAVRSRIGHDLPPLVAHLDKRIPMTAGLGGGSSDAAAAIEAAEVMWGIGLSPQVRSEIEVELGADVPFFARGGGHALVTGRGDKVQRLEAPASEPGILLVTPPFGLSTAHVFARFDELDRPKAKPAIDLAEALRDPASLHDANDLWPAAASIEPRLAPIRAELERVAATPWMISGSGSTMFALYPSPEEAAEAGRRLVSAESETLGGAIISAVDLKGPEPLWRYP
ncbi:MAG TPA: 4-(cytidine 5'-diphospho)-2-C-methyl-D-erythritol kinase [Candidatus Limnocylindria bacterium]|nr:4-(cytidine 5'-diphospho)-2-C-methyl-D-erythritol kinase [Candidatus Limnocylindria bacterium]